MYRTLFFTIIRSWTGRGLKDGLLWGSASWELKIVLQKLRSQCFGGIRKRALSNRWYISRYSSISLIWTNLLDWNCASVSLIKLADISKWSLHFSWEKGYPWQHNFNFPGLVEGLKFIFLIVDIYRWQIVPYVHVVERRRHHSGWTINFLIQA